MGDRRAGHAHQGGNVDYTLFTVAEEPENLDSATIAKLAKNVSNSLKIGLLEGFLQRFYIIFIGVMMGEQFFGHSFVSFGNIVYYIITQYRQLDKAYP